jgi:MFS transporter, SET family, sugar efflux transporter
VVESINPAYADQALRSAYECSNSSGFAVARPSTVLAKSRHATPPKSSRNTDSTQPCLTRISGGTVVLPLYITGTLHKPDSEVGLLFTVCALVEIPTALATMLLPAGVRKMVILVGMAAFAAYFVLVAAATTMPFLIGTQVARGIALAVVGTLGITYVQDLAPRSPGRATTLFANTLTIGSLVSGVLAGATSQALGFRPALLICAALAVSGGVLLIGSRHSTVASDSGTVIAAFRGGVGGGRDTARQ